MPDSHSLPAAIYPSEWHPINAELEIECRQISMDTYQLRSLTHIITINKEGFEAYREGDDEFEEWQRTNNVQAERLPDIPSYIKVPENPRW